MGLAEIFFGAIILCGLGIKFPAFFEKLAKM